MNHFYALCLLFLLSCQSSPEKNKIAQRVAVANGLESFGKVRQLSFTFHAQRDTAAPSSRQWQWFPQTNEVVFITDSGSTRFNRSDTSTKELKQLNARFTNDEYWLLFPLHLGWDEGYALLDSGSRKAPISGEILQQLTVKYNERDGFTPGDAYDLYLDKDLRIREWAFHKSGTPEPSLMTTWEEYKNVSGLMIAQNHRSKDGGFRIWFTGIDVQ